MNDVDEAERANDDTVPEGLTGYALFRQMGEQLFGSRTCPCQCHIGQPEDYTCRSCKARHDVSLRDARSHDSYRRRPGRRGR